MGECKDCRWWMGGNRSLVVQDRYLCLRINKDDGNSNEKAVISTETVASPLGIVAAALTTAAVFGCTLWEA